jgi:outer membrane lipoprotein SlyB
MNSPTIVPTKTPIHPLMVGALIAIILVCGLAAAALLGWLPSSTGRNAEAESAANAQVAADAAKTPSGKTQALAAPIDPPGGAAHKVQHAPPVQRVAVAAVCHDCGVIDAVTPVETRGQGTGMGTAGGAILGGLLGNQVGSGNGRKLATVAGAVGGAVAGNQIEGNMKSTRSYNIVVRLNDGSTRTFHQSAQPSWQAGDRVRIVNGALRSDD